MSVIDDSGQGCALACLSPEARSVYGCLAAVGGSAPVEVVAALAYLPVPDARRHLRQLVRVGAAMAAEGWYAAAANDTVSEVVVDVQAWSRAVGWYASCAFNAASVLDAVALPVGEQVPESGWQLTRIVYPHDALAWYAACHGELVWAVEKAVAVGEHGLGWRLALLVANIASVAGPLGAWERMLDLGLIAAERDGRADARGFLLEYKGKLLLAAGRFDDAGRALAEAVGVRSTDDRAALNRSNNALGLLMLRRGARGDYPVARILFAGTLDLARKAGDEEFTAFARMNLGAVLARLGETGEAKQLLEAAAAYQRERELRYYLANTLQNLAACHRIEGDHRRALDLATQAVSLATRAQLPLFLAGPLCELARAHLALGEPELARAAFAEARAIYAELGDEVRADALAREIAEHFRESSTHVSPGAGR
jgi:tetratricopeptide (TPR) repeat protein